MRTDLSTAGNRTSVTVNGGTPTTTTYNAANQITNAGFSYDNAGNLTNDGTATYTYDALNRTRVRGTTTYTYTGDGTLVSQATGGVTTRYTQDLAAPLSQVLQTQVGAAARTDYLYGLNRLASLNSGAKTWYVADALGSVRRTVTDAGTPLGVINYDPWGTPESGTVPTFGFTGEVQDVGAGLVNLRARWYSTGQGRFTSVDPFAGMPETPYSQHQYQYGYSDPVLLSDPSGRDPWWTDPDYNRSPNEPRRQDTERKYAECIEADYLNTISANPDPNFQCGSFELEAQVLPYAVSIAADLTPVVGIGKGIIEAFTGCDLITGDQLGYWRYAGFIPLFGKFRLLKEISIEVRATGKLTTALRVLDPELRGLIREARVLQEASELEATRLRFSKLRRDPAVGAFLDNNGKFKFIASGQDELTAKVLTRANRIGHTFLSDKPAAKYASHAEKKAYELLPNKPIGVNNSMCADCRNYFIKLASDTGRPQIVADPARVRIFNPDGTVAVIRADDTVIVYPPGEPVMNLK